MPLVTAALVTPALAKGTKDHLKRAGWLDENLRPAVQPDGRIAFPLA